MLLKSLPAAVVAVAFSAVAAQAQGRAPAELPPSGFAGQQYVDSRGCLFIRAGHGGQVTWVARIDRNRKPICGQTPSAAVMADARRELAAPAVPAPAPPPRAAAAAAIPAARYTPPPVRFGAPTPLQGAAPPMAPPPAARTAVAPVAPPVRDGARTAGCPGHVPVGKIYELHRGGHVLVCASGPHRLTGLRPGDVERMALIPPAPASGYHVVPVRVTGTARLAGADLLDPPAGYKAAWKDDRLNPDRATGTAQGRAAMLQVWTDRVPQQLRDPAHARPSRVVAGTKSTQGVQPAAAGARFVQVGSFGVAENAARAAGRLQAMGLPVQIGHARMKGRSVQVVSAGPFASDAAARAALGALRGAGFGDAILRR